MKDSIIIKLLFLVFWIMDGNFAQSMPVQPNDEIKIISADVKPALIYGKNSELYQPIVLQVDNQGKMQTVDLLIDGKISEKRQLKIGTNTIEICIPEIKKETDVVIALSVKSKIIE